MKQGEPFELKCLKQLNRREIKWPQETVMKRMSCIRVSYVVR